MTLPSACTDHCLKCGASWRDEDFGTDGNGRIVLNHVCERAYVDPKSLAHYEHTKSGVRTCGDCGGLFTGTASSIRCRRCRQRIERERNCARLALARKRRCAGYECRMQATKSSKLCRRCQRSAKIRRALGQVA